MPLYENDFNDFLKGWSQARKANEPTEAELKDQRKAQRQK